MWFLHEVWLKPLFAGIGIYMIYQDFGPSLIGGCSLVLLAVPLQIFFGKRIARNRYQALVIVIYQPKAFCIHMPTYTQPHIHTHTMYRCTHFVMTIWKVCFHICSAERDKLTDKRISAITELLSGMRFIKMYCWEKPFGDFISKIRWYVHVHVLSHILPIVT